MLDDASRQFATKRAFDWLRQPFDMSLIPGTTAKAAHLDDTDLLSSARKEGPRNS
jgi:hypothetical protein